MMKKLALSLGTLLVVALLATGLWLVSSPAQVSQAQEPTQTPQAELTPPADGTWADYRDYFLNAFAQQLGITLDKLKEAYNSAFSETIDKAVQDGKITADQAAQMKTDAENAVSQGNLPGFEGPFGHGGGKHGGRGDFGMGMGRRGGFDLSVAAQTLNMTEADLLSALQGGKTLADIATEKNVDLATIKAAVLANLKTQLDQAVTDGKLTQEQADQMYEQAATNFDTMASQAWQGRPGHDGGRPDFDLDGQNPNQLNPNNQTPNQDNNSQGQSSQSNYWPSNPAWETH